MLTPTHTLDPSPGGAAAASLGTGRACAALKQEPSFALRNAQPRPVA